MMRIYFRTLGGHVHCRVFTDGAKSGDLVFSLKEFEMVRSHCFSPYVTWITE
jgi:hypothetical protein